MENAKSCIVLNRHVDLREKSGEFLQLRYALPMYGWMKSRKGHFLLYPSMKMCLGSMFSLETIWLCAFLCAMTLSLLFVVNDIVGVLGMLVAISFLWFRIRRMFHVYKSLPRLPIVVVDTSKRQVVFKRNIPCVQIRGRKKVIRFCDIRSAAWRFSRYLDNDGDTIELDPVMEFNLSYKGFYLCHTENGTEKQELFFCGQKVVYETLDKIIRYAKGCDAA